MNQYKIFYIKTICKVTKNIIKQRKCRWKSMGKTFQFKKFTIAQDRCAMKVGTDGVLLGAWARGGKRVLDIGTGTGLVALMMAQRFTDAVVDAVEIDHDTAGQAMENVSSSPFANRVKVFAKALQDFEPDAPYDSIVTNPPFFSNSLLAPDSSRTMARHTVALAFADILAFAARHLAEDGEISAIIPTDCMESFSQEAFMRGMFQTRLYMIKTVERKPAKRSLIAFSKSRPMTFDKAEVVLMGKDGKRSDWYDLATREFYL